MIRNRNRCGSFVHSAPRIVARQHALDDDWTPPMLSDPAQVCPGHSGFRQGSIDIDQTHRPLARDHNVRKYRQTAIPQKADEPTRWREHLRKKRDFLQQAAADEFLHAIAIITLPDSRHRGIDGDNERGESRNARPFNDGFGSPTATHQVELIEDGSGRNGFYVFQFVSRKRQENIANASPASSSCGRHFASGMHKAAVPDRCKQDRKSKMEAQNARAQIAARERDRMPRPKSDIVKYPAILP